MLGRLRLMQRVVRTGQMQRRLLRATAVSRLPHGTVSMGSDVDDADVMKMTVKQLRAVLAQRGVDAPSKARKAELQALALGKVPPPVKKDPLEKKTVKQLKEMLKEMEVSVPTKARKMDLVALARQSMTASSGTDDAAAVSPDVPTPPSSVSSDTTVTAGTHQTEDEVDASVETQGAIESEATGASDAASSPAASAETTETKEEAKKAKKAKAEEAWWVGSGEKSAGANTGAQEVLDSMLERLAASGDVVASLESASWSSHESWPKWMKKHASAAVMAPALYVGAMASFPPNIAWRVAASMSLLSVIKRLAKSATLGDFRLMKAGRRFGQIAVGAQLLTVLGLHPSLASVVLGWEANVLTAAAVAGGFLRSSEIAAALGPNGAKTLQRTYSRGLRHESLEVDAAVLAAHPMLSSVEAAAKEAVEEAADSRNAHCVAAGLGTPDRIRVVGPLKFHICERPQGSTVDRVSPGGITSASIESSTTVQGTAHVQGSTGHVARVPFTLEVQDGVVVPVLGSLARASPNTLSTDIAGCPKRAAKRRKRKNKYYAYHAVRTSNSGQGDQVQSDTKVTDHRRYHLYDQIDGDKAHWERWSEGHQVRYSFH